jgi:tetratricopeptide (TPR) repeat protein
MERHNRRRKNWSAAQALKLSALGLACLAVLLLSVGCNVRQFFGGESSADKILAGIRPASGESDRLLRNFRYLKMAGRADLALRELEEAHQRDPGNAKIVDLLAQCYEEMGDWNRAETLYQEALARDRDNQALANNLGFSYYLAGKYGQAEALFREILQRAPHNATARNNLGLLLVKTARQEEAYRLWREQAGEAEAQERFHQALAALGLTPRVDLARRVEPDKPEPTPIAAFQQAAPSPAPVPAPVRAARPSATQVALAPPATQPAAGEAVRPEQPAKPVLLVEALEPQGGQAADSSPSSAAPSPAMEQESAGRSPHAAPASLPAGPPAPPVRETPGPALPAEPPALASPARTAPSPVWESQPTPTPVKSAETQPAAAPLATPVTPPAASPAQAPAKSPVQTAAQAAPRQVPAVAATPAATAAAKRPTVLTVQELLDTRIDIRNGNGVSRMAHLNRTWLGMEGFYVASIGNHINFGLDQTVIHYGPGAERLALSLHEAYYPQADLRPNDKLGRGTDVRIILGHDQKSRRQQIAARVALLDLRAQLAQLLASSGKPSPAAPPKTGLQPLAGLAR